jgi:hypothetical protein
VTEVGMYDPSHDVRPESRYMTGVVMFNRSRDV